MPGSPAPSPRRGNGRSPTPLGRMAMPSRLPSSSSTAPLDMGYHDPYGPRTNPVMGFSPKSAATARPSVSGASITGSPRPPHLALNTANHHMARLSPQLSTPIEQTFPQAFPNDGSPRPLFPSPGGDLPPRSRRNSAAIVSISLSSRSRSRTPRGTAAPLPSGSGQATPNQGASTVTLRGEASAMVGREVMVEMGSRAPGVEEMEEWAPAGGMLLESESDDVNVEDKRVESGGRNERTGSGEWDASPEVNHVMSRGMLFGEGLEFQGEVIRPAVGRLGTGANGDDVGLPLRRGGSEAGKVTRGAVEGAAHKVYEVVRPLGTGSYAIVYLVRERGGRKREFALKCLSKQNLEDHEIETQLFEATIHLSLPLHTNIVTLHQTLQTKDWLFLMLEMCVGQDLFWWLEKSRDASPPVVVPTLRDEYTTPSSSSKFSSSSIPFSSSQLFSGLSNHLSSSFNSAHRHPMSSQHSVSPASQLIAHKNGGQPQNLNLSQTPPTPSLLSTFTANTLLSQHRLRLIASMFSQMCESIAVCHDAGISHRDIKPENFICCDSIELEPAAEGGIDFGPQARKKVIVKITDFGLATTEQESWDMECGSKPYMSYECRNNVGPSYLPALADVWSLGIVFINMLFHRNPWKDPSPGDENFENFFHDPVGFLLSKFTGIGREVASYLAHHVLCVDVEARVGAREFGLWVKSLPDMIGGRKAIHQLQMAQIEPKASSTDNSLFIKSPIETTQHAGRKPSTSALTSSAPMAPLLSTLPPPSQLAPHSATRSIPELQHDDIPSAASTSDEQPTPFDASGLTSPDSVDEDNTTRCDSDSRSPSTHRRRKRGMRKGKAAQAALLAAAGGPSQEERDALCVELIDASQHLARDLSKHARVPDFDVNRVEDFPPLGADPANAAAKKSKWKGMMKMSSGNPEIAALAKRVAERDASSGGNWTAPAMLQHDINRATLSKHAMKQAATMSSGISSLGTVSSATSSTSGVDDDDWRRPRDHENDRRGRQEVRDHSAPRHGESTARAKQAALAAAAITGNMEPIGAFGRGPSLSRGMPPSSNASATSSKSARTAVSMSEQRTAPRSQLAMPPIILEEQLQTSNELLATSIAATASIDTFSTEPSRPMLSSVASSSTIVAQPAAPSPAAGQGHNKHKLKGQIQSLAKMLSPQKAKGKD